MLIFNRVKDLSSSLSGPIITGELKELNIVLDRCYLGYTRDPDRKRVLRATLYTELLTSGYRIRRINTRHPVDIQSYCERYNEYVQLNVFGTVKNWFEQLRAGMRRPGWTLGHYPPTAPQPPVQPIGFLGEGIAGFMMERYYGFSLLHRPVRGSPDAILARPREIGLMEVKTTVRISPDVGRLRGLEPSLTSAIVKASIILIDFWAKIHHITGRLPYVGYPVGVAIRNITSIRGRDYLTVEAAIVRLRFS